jgi:hypothetical protein
MELAPVHDLSAVNQRHFRNFHFLVQRDIRNGDYPVMRGTAIILNDRNALLWTNGFVPRLDTYIGLETPNPLSITVLRSTGNAPPSFPMPALKAMIGNGTRIS